MKTIRRRVPRRTVITFACGICDTWYRKPDQAWACEKRLREPTGFKVGDRVLVEAHCECKKFFKKYLLKKLPWIKGRVVKKIGPLLPDRGYETEVIKIPARLKMHVFQYDVVNRCHFCKKEVTARLYAPEIQLRQI